MVLRRCRKLLGDEPSARDAMHDVFVQVLSRSDELVDQAPSSLLFRIATNVCLNRLRTRKRRPEDGDPSLLMAIAEHTDPAARSAARSALEALFRHEPGDTALIAVLHLYSSITGGVLDFAWKLPTEAFAVLHLTPEIRPPPPPLLRVLRVSSRP